MEIKDVIIKRESVRSFQDKKIPDLSEIISLARKCPSAGAIRGFDIIVTKKEIAPYNAPLYAVILTNPEAYARYGERGKNLYSVQDATIFGAYFQLLLVDMGLSSVWIGAFRESRVQRDIKTELRPIAIIAVGYEKC